MRSSAAGRTRPTIGDAVVVLLVLALAAAVLFALRPAKAERLTAVITVDNVVVETVELSALAQPKEIALDNCPYPLVIQAENGRIRILESTCPGNDCVHTSWVNRVGGRIICLPNRMIVTLVGDVPDDVDFVAK